MFENILGRVTLAVTIALIYLQQYIKSVDQDVPAPHTRVDHFDVFRFDRFILLANRFQLCLHLGLLLRFV
ncbi:hypothetical protein D3C73_1443630 [compost metagenome]